MRATPLDRLTHALQAIGKFIRHGYDGIDVSRLWMVATDDLPVLKAALLTMNERYRS